MAPHFDFLRRVKGKVDEARMSTREGECAMCVHDARRPTSHEHISQSKDPADVLLVPGISPLLLPNVAP